ncbi:MAG: type II toxin-antitoxin system PrlF family antitoxin [Proteobacteria bacterium]|nr:type II toxin-antitoxin system PrlF family antitoxin [Pseudomonadota bacterium]
MKDATSVITSKFQTTIPKAIRENMKLSVSDTISWVVEDGKIFVRVKKNNFLSYKNSIKVGPGDTQKDIGLAKKLNLERYR